MSNSGGQENLSQALVQERIFFSFPSDETEQRKITGCLNSLDALITAETQKLAALNRHKRGLMQQLFPTSDATDA
jgi:type I restriction enzyme S subunit